MHYLRFISFVVYVALFYVTGGNHAVSQSAGEIQPYFRTVELPLAVAVVHGDGSSIGPSFFEALVESDIGGFLRHEERARSFSDANAVVFILDNWASAARLPFQEQLSYIYDPISVLPSSVAGFGTRLLADDGTQIGIVFISDDFLPEDAITCASQIFFRSLVVGFDRGELIFNENVRNC